MVNNQNVSTIKVMMQSLHTLKETPNVAHNHASEIITIYVTPIHRSKKLNFAENA
jgi:hypothetical protein